MNPLESLPENVRAQAAQLVESPAYKAVVAAIRETCFNRFCTTDVAQKDLREDIYHVMVATNTLDSALRNLIPPPKVTEPDQRTM